LKHPEPLGKGRRRQARGSEARSGARGLRRKPAAARSAAALIRKTPLAGRLAYLAERGGIAGRLHASSPFARRAAGPAFGCPDLLLQIRRTPQGFSSAALPPDTQNAPCGASGVSGGEGGIRTPEAL